MTFYQSGGLYFCIRKYESSIILRNNSFHVFSSNMIYLEIYLRVFLKLVINECIKLGLLLKVLLHILKRGHDFESNRFAID